MRVSAHPNGQCDASGTFMLRRSHRLMNENHLRISCARDANVRCELRIRRRYIYMRQFPFQFPYGSAESVFSAIKHVNNRVNCAAYAMRKENTCPASPMLSLINIDERRTFSPHLRWAKSSCFDVLGIKTGMQVLVMHGMCESHTKSIIIYVVG